MTARGGWQPRWSTRGVKPGEPVGTLMWNSSWHRSLFRDTGCRGVLLTLNLRLSPDDIAYIIGNAGTRIVLVDDVLLPLFEQVLPALRARFKHAGLSTAQTAILRDVVF